MRRKTNMNKLRLDNAVIRTKGKGIIEDTTEYGEFIASFDDWITPEEQKKKAEYLQNLKKKK